MAAIKPGGTICAAINCHNTRFNTKISLFRFPKEEERCKKWVINCRRKDLDGKSALELYNQYRMCANHFEDSQFMRPDLKNKLVWNAIPTKFDVPNPPPRITPKRPLPKKRIIPCDELPLAKKPKQGTEIVELTEAVNEVAIDHAYFRQTDVNEKNTSTPRKQKLVKKVKNLKQQINRLQMNRGNSNNERNKIKLVQSVCEGLDKVLPSQTAEFVKSQVKLQNKKSKKGIRWSKKDKLFALSVFYHSRKAYSILKKLFLMPSKSTLLKLLAKTNIYPGFNEGIFEALKQRVGTMEDRDRNCVLIFDEMTIKSNLSYNRHGDSIEGFEDFGVIGHTKFVANHALAFMVRGLASKWKQSIGYFLISGPASPQMLQSLTKQAIDKLKEVGLSVKVLICVQGSNNRSFVESLEGISESKPFFMYNTQKVYVMYDPPHLLKNIRNNLKKNGWDHIVHFYEFDKTNEIRLAPKLSSTHIDLPPFSPMRVNLAAQVLSSPVAPGISTLVALKNLPEEALATAKMVKKFDCLFNAFNSRCLRSSQPFAHAFSETSGHREFLLGCLEYLSQLNVPNGQKIHCIRGWKISIKALLALWDDLRKECDFSFLLTSRLNQDCVENLFSIIRGKGGKRDNPDAREFRAAFRQVAFDQLLSPSKSSNCDADIDAILLSIGSIGKCPKTRELQSQVHEVQDDMRCVANKSQSQTTNATSQQVNLMEAAFSQGQVPSQSTSQSCPDFGDAAMLPWLSTLLVMKPMTNMPKQNVEAYIGGYLLRKAGVKDCEIVGTNLCIPRLLTLNFTSSLEIKHTKKKIL